MAAEIIVLGSDTPSDLSIRGLANWIDRMKALTIPTVEVPVTHRFTPGLYIREVMVPAGSGLVTFVHRYEHPFVVSVGKIMVWTESDGVEIISAPYTGITKPGTCRLALAVEDTIWTTFHPNPDNETDVEKLEKRLVFTPREAAELQDQKGTKWLS